MIREARTKPPFTLVMIGSTLGDLQRAPCSGRIFLRERGLVLAPNWQPPKWDRPGWDHPKWEPPKWEPPKWEPPDWEPPDWEPPEWQDSPIEEEPTDQPDQPA